MTYAAGEGHVGVVRLLLDAGVDPDAVYAQRPDGADVGGGLRRTRGRARLLDAGARVDRRDDRGKTALDIAREQRQDATVALLEAAGARGARPPR